MTMACGDRGSDDLNVSDSFSALKLRPIFPVSARNTVISPIFTPPYRHCTHYTNLFSLNLQYPGYVRSAQIKSRACLNRQLPLASSRWNPTAEQLLALEELYRRGTRTPTAEQIQQITAYLRRFGKIEGKNVFYWFQNHKARERQKRRREMASVHLPEHQHHDHSKSTLDNKESAGYEVNHAKKKSAPLCESGNSMHRAERKTHGWVQYSERMAHRTCQSIEMPCSPSIQTSSHTKLSNSSDHYDILMTTPTNCKEGGFSHLEEYRRRESKTLNLFPAPHGYDCDANSFTGEDTKELPITARDQFFEFLPLKN